MEGFKIHCGNRKNPKMTGSSPTQHDITLRVRDTISHGRIQYTLQGGAKTGGVLGAPRTVSAVLKGGNIFRTMPWQGLVTDNGKSTCILLHRGKKDVRSGKGRPGQRCRAPLDSMGREPPTPAPVFWHGDTFHLVRHGSVLAIPPGAMTSSSRRGRMLED